MSNPFIVGIGALAALGGVAYYFNTPNPPSPVNASNSLPNAVNTSQQKATVGAPCGCSSGDTQIFASIGDLVSSYTRGVNATLEQYNNDIKNALPRTISQYVDNIAGWQQAIRTQKQLIG